MAQQEQNGSGAEPESHERTESIRRRTDDDAADFAEEVEGAPGPSAPTPREQWFGGFEGAAPPPPPYARLPEDTPPPTPGTAFRAPAPEEGGNDTPDEPEELPSNTVRLLPGARNRPPSGPWQEERRPQRPQRLGGPAGEERDPLAPRRTPGDSDVPEPEQLPPLEAERPEPPEQERPGPSPWAAGPAPQPPSPLGAAEDPGFAGAGRTENAGMQNPWGLPGLGAASVERAEPLPDRPAPPASLTGPRDTGPGSGLGPGPNPWSGSQAPARPLAPHTDQGETSDSLSAATLVRNRRYGPSSGWRKAVHNASLGLINPGESPKVLRERELVARACTPVASGHHRVAVLSLKGGVGKTTTTVALGATLASLRGDRVLAVDANPDRGTLSDKVRLETAATIRDLLNERHLVSRYADIRGFTSQAPSRLEILASDRDPAVSEAFSDADYREVARIVEHFYSICITDCGTGLLHAAMRGVLGLADQVVLVSSASVDGARSASATLDWLDAHGHGDLVRGAAVVLSMVRSNSKSSVDLNRLEDHFAGRCRSVVRVPWDGHLEEGAEVDLEQLAPATKDAYLQLAASVGEAFAR
ncbi:MinD/ParA family protein [Nocardiopsis sp. B62]|uniref:MinD/ParA family ATP-binding protein n=1 Tax=Nocardiopsis sp. B62 TaxID=2824874 RepID=UPI001B38520B|nr:MinD/ParA family protein [Nocardiopsis sp. B62]MBQ1083371.1 AAA family ATPase [Nocardiopsis sp. B62]